MLDRAGVLLALGTDWTASGSMNLLRELRCAGELNSQQLGGYFSAAALFRMATINGAIATATNDQLGLSPRAMSRTSRSTSMPTRRAAI